MIRAEQSSQSVICVICVICVIWWELEKKLFCTMMLKSERRCDRKHGNDEDFSQFRWSWWKKRFQFKTLNFIDRISHQIIFHKAAATAVWANKELGAVWGHSVTRRKKYHHWLSAQDLQWFIVSLLIRYWFITQPAGLTSCWFLLLWTVSSEYF